MKTATLYRLPESVTSLPASRSHPSPGIPSIQGSAFPSQSVIEFSCELSAIPNLGSGSRFAFSQGDSSLPRNVELPDIPFEPSQRQWLYRMRSAP